MTGFLAPGSAAGIVSLGEVLVILVVASVIVLTVSTVLASGAVALRARRTSRTRRTRERFEAWRQSLYSFLYDGAEPEVVWEGVDAGNGFDFLNFLISYVRRLDGSERMRVRTLAEPHIGQILHLTDHRSDSVRARAVQTLSELGLPVHADRVIAALDDPSQMVAMVAASTLARDETPEFAQQVLDQLGRFAHWRQDFLSAMLASMGAGAVPALRSTLTDREAPARVRAVVADALAALSDPLAADAAEEALTSSTDVELRAASLRLIARVGRGEHLDAVRVSLESPELPVRLSAIRALGRFGTEDDLTPLEAAAKEDPSPWVAIAAARALREGGGRGALEALAGSEHPRSALGLQVISEAPSW